MREKVRNIFCYVQFHFTDLVTYFSWLCLSTSLSTAVATAYQTRPGLKISCKHKRISYISTRNKTQPGSTFLMFSKGWKNNAVHCTWSVMLLRSTDWIAYSHDWMQNLSGNDDVDEKLCYKIIKLWTHVKATNKQWQNWSMNNFAFVCLDICLQNIIAKKCPALICKTAAFQNLRSLLLNSIHCHLLETLSLTIENIKRDGKVINTWGLSMLYKVWRLSLSTLKSNMNENLMK